MCTRTVVLFSKPLYFRASFLLFQPLDLSQHMLQHFFLELNDQGFVSDQRRHFQRHANMGPQPLGSLKAQIAVGTVKYVFVFTIQFSFCIRIGELCRAKRVRFLLCGIFTFSCRKKSMEPCVRFFPHPCVFLYHPFIFSFVEQ